MKKKILSTLILLILMLNICALAQEPQKEEYRLSLKEAIELAKKDNPEMIVYDEKIKDYEYQTERARIEMKNSKGVVKIPDGIQLVLVQKGYNVKQNEINRETAQMEKEQFLNKLAYSVTEKYFNTKLAQALLNTANDTYDMALKNYQNVELQYKLGMVSELDLKNAEIVMLEAKNNKQRCNRSYEIVSEDLKIALGIDNPKAILTLTDEIDKPQFNPNLNEDTQKAMDTRVDIFKLKKTHEQSLLYREAMSVAGKTSTYYSSANAQAVQCEYVLNNTKKLIALSIKSDYLNVYNAEDSLTVANEKAELKKKEYEVAKLKYELGLITNSELTSQITALSNAKTELDNAKLTYKLAVEKYDYEIKTGL